MKLYSMTVPAIVLLSLYTGKKTISTPVIVGKAAAPPPAPTAALIPSPAGVNPDAYQMAMKGYQHLRKVGQLRNTRVLTIIDYTLSSLQKRLFVVDVKSGKVLYNTYVAHGMNSGKEYAHKFSNALESLETSLGFYVTMNAYEGKNGLALRLKGMEKGINDNATRRGIVLHGADYVSVGYGRQKGFMGRSEGCPAVPKSQTGPIVRSILGGSAVFAYYPSAQYLGKSKLVTINGMEPVHGHGNPLP
ncbi:murein L,D-transpeptidase catalytic domain family protein [Dinghuibacter silviterrae]|uniref:L,D-transpeptidase-like protein n=1 Tax=Dinghuibacter silviterrae TaxID=1539049 RepID=A0A4R8DR08_9BACT|nr:murein L,D-transpeptidase catalytic domain family protein [Dinghuibacter silviterrae]TDW99766.1 L,D-transpeptidase-like protein [Dinghuibacter silviterrae]